PSSPCSFVRLISSRRCVVTHTVVVVTHTVVVTHGFSPARRAPRPGRRTGYGELSRRRTLPPPRTARRGGTHVPDAKLHHTRGFQPGPAAGRRGRIRPQPGAAGGSGRVRAGRGIRVVPRDRSACGHRAVPAR